MNIFNDTRFWNQIVQSAVGVSADPKYRWLYYQCDGAECSLQIETGIYKPVNHFRNEYLRTNNFLIYNLLVLDLTFHYKRDTMFQYTLIDKPTKVEHLAITDPQLVEHHLMMIKLQLSNV